MSTLTRWIVDEEVPEVVCFVTSSSDGIKARFVRELERAERTCEVVRMAAGSSVYVHELTCGHEVETLDPEQPNYCMECGARVIG